MDFLKFASESRLLEAELHLAQAQSRPNLSLSVGVRRLQATKDAALVAGFSMPLPVWDRNQGAIRESQVRVSQSAALRDAALVRARASLVGLYQEMNAARARVETLRSEALHQFLIGRMGSALLDRQPVQVPDQVLVPFGDHGRESPEGCSWALF